MEHIARIVAYWRSCLADSARRNIDPSRLEKSHSVEITIGPSRSCIPSQIASQIVDNFNRKKKKKLPRQKTVSQEILAEEDEYIKWVSVLICPIVARPKTDHTIHRTRRERPLTPIWIPARLSHDGYLAPSDELVPWIPRDLLEPAQVAETIGDVEAMDHFLTLNPTIQNGENPDRDPRWNDVWQYSNNMLENVTGQTVEEFNLKGYERETTPRILLDEDMRIIPSHIIRLYDEILHRLEERSLSPPKLLPRLTSFHDEPLRPLLNKNQRVEKSAQHLGHMHWKFPLSASQREAIDHFSTLSEGELLAINGPPGTGKTTLLQSIVASLWVEAALYESEPPIIFAASANNQAVTNIIDSFGSVPEDESLLGGRWIPDLESYGFFCPSSSMTERGLDSRYQITTNWPNPSEFLLPPSSGKRTRVNIEDEEFVSHAERYFLKCCRAYMKNCGVANVADIKDSVKLLHRQLEEKIKAIRQGIQTWLQMERIQVELSERYGAHGRIETHLKQCANDLETCQKKIVQYREAQCGWLDHVDTVLSFFEQLVKDAENQEQGFAEKLRRAGRDWRDHADTILSFFDELVKDIGNQERDFAEKLRQIQTELSDRYGRHGGIETHLNQCANDLETCQKKIVQYKEAQCGWLDHADTMPWWMTLFGFLPWVKSRIEIRNRRYLLSIRSTCLVDPVDIKGVTDFFDQLVKETENQERGFAERLRQIKRDSLDHADTILSFFEQRVNNARDQERDFAEKLRQAKRDWERLQRAEQAWNAWCAQHGFSADGSSLLDTMDTRLRYTAFKLATHYWEGRWLLEMREQFNTDYKESQSEKKQKKRWRRYAKLAPCFVSTLYTLPNYMHAFNGERITLFDFIDLLIIDEAGQVSPDVSGATFALAKKALVVGDTQQLEPIWGITKSIDIGNLREKKVVSIDDDDEVAAFFSTGLDASSGSLMKIAQRASPYQKSDERGPFERGMFLAEHRRCVPEIIQYCNRLAYGGRLVPMRECEVDYPLPHLGYIHISGQSRRVRGSRNNRDEAAVIVRWIAEHRDILVSHYSEKHLSLDQIVAIITPFRTQADLVQDLLRKSGIAEPLKVGTVHIVQGAECPVVIFSPVYGIDDRPPYFFDRGNSMLNVAVSRAQDSFLVFGNMNNFDQEASSKPSGILASFLFRDEGNEITQAASVRDPLFG